MKYPVGIRGKANALWACAGLAYGNDEKYTNPLAPGITTPMLEIPRFPVSLVK